MITAIVFINADVARIAVREQDWPELRERWQQTLRAHGWPLDREVKARNELKTQSAVGRGTGVLGDDKKMSVSPESSRFVARDELRPPEILTFDMKGNVNRVLSFLNGQILLGTNDLASDDDNVWTDRAAVDAHAYAGFTYDYFFKRFNRRGLDNDPELIRRAMDEPDTMMRLASQGREFAARAFGWDEIVTRLSATYHSAVAARTGS